MAARSSPSRNRSAKKSAPVKKRKKGATRKSTPIPGWVWLVTGLALGLFVTLIVHLVKIAPQAAKVREQAVAEAKTREVEEKKKKAEQAHKDKKRYDFYTMLPQEKVEVPKDLEAVADAPAYYQFMLQTGAFSSVADADRVRAELIMQGFEAQIRSSTSDKGTVHRLVIGPFPNRSRMAKARSMLIAKGVATMMVNAPKLPPSASTSRDPSPSKP
jgi:cell division protein FtsN